MLTLEGAESPRPKEFNFRIGLLLLALAVTVPYLPVFLGYVPFPADIVSFFPPWAGTSAVPCCGSAQHSELGDLVTQIYPWRTLNAELRSGHIPLWNFYVFMGVPYQAMPMSALFFPLHLVFAILSLPLAWSLLFVIRGIVIAITTAIFVKRLGASPLAALISGFIFALSGWVLAFQGRPQLDSAMWLPLMFLSVDQLRSGPTYTSIVLGAVAFALPVLAGHPEVAVEVILPALLYAAYRLFPLEPRAGRYVAAFGAVGILSLLLAAVQLLPTLEWAGLIARSLNERWGPLASLQSVGILSRDLLHHPNADGVSIPEGASYIGAFTFAVLPFVLLWRKRLDVLFFGVLAFLCMEVAYGWQPGFWISNHIPVFAGLPNWRLLVVADFGFAVLAGLAISAIQSRCDSPELRFLPSGPLVWLMGGAAAGGLIVSRLFGHTAVPVRWNLLLVLLSAVIVVFAITRRIHATDFLRVACVVIAADLFAAGFAVIPFFKPANIFPSSPLFDFLIPRARPLWRVCPLDVVYGAQFELPYRLSSPAGYDFPNRRTATVLDLFNTREEARALRSESVLAAPKGLVDLTGTRYFVTTDWNASTSRLEALPKRFHKVFSWHNVQVFENPDAVPLVSFFPAAAAQVIADDADQLKAIGSAVFDGKRTLILPSRVDEYYGSAGKGAGPEVTEVTQSVDEVKLTLGADQDGLVYFNESYYPGWLAEVDGETAPVLRANYIFMAVPVRRGQHTVRFHFLPASFRIGSALSGMALLLIIAGFAIPRVLGRQPILKSEDPVPGAEDHVGSSFALRGNLNRVIGLLVLVGLLFAIGLVARYGFRSPVTRTPPAQPSSKLLTIPADAAVVGYLDVVNGRSVISVTEGSEIGVSGWAGCSNPGAPLAKVEVLVDNRVAGSAATSVRRHDVAQAYGRSDFELSGWNASVPANGINAGIHSLAARVTCADGATGDLSPFQLVVKSR